MPAGDARIFINGIEFPGATFRLEIHPVQRLVLSQPFPAKLSFGRMLDLGSEAQGDVILTVEARSKSSDAFLFRCSGAATSFYVSHESRSGQVTDMEYLELSCDSIEYKEA